jgi:DNA-binding MarR family transcriptional regulator
MRTYAHSRSIYTHIRDAKRVMRTASEFQATPCNCAALREAARYVTQLYDQHLAAAGLLTTQYSILARLKRLGPTTISALAQDMVMDRTTLGRNIVPLQRRRLIVVRRGRDDGRSKELHLTKTGLARLGAGLNGWTKAQAQFEATLGSDRASELRGLLRAVVGSDSRTDIAAE